ncbi:ComF family protein [Candidatus Gottesmanbacteria bacterium]|nr:ComF family protein [Candidatus Gottesmanbacteria bacterium]
MGLLDILFLKRCINCGKVGKYFCDCCRSTIQVIEPNEAICPICEHPAIGGAVHPRCRTRYMLDGLTSFFHYEGAIRKAIKAIKYRLVSDIAQEYISLIAPGSLTQVTRQLRSTSVLVPIPLHASRYRERGFNQAEVLGRILARRLKIPMRTDILRRTKNTTAQVEMKKREDRLKNMKNVFTVSSTASMGQAHIFLFDDVFTTGATMRAAASSLRRSGVSFVWALTLAR